MLEHIVARQLELTKLMEYGYTTMPYKMWLRGMKNSLKK